MSCNRESIAWQSKDKTWNLGFFEFYEVGNSFDEDFDHEWDVEYMDHAFWWVQTGLSTVAEGQRKYSEWNANPGSPQDEISYAGNEALCEKYDLMALDRTNPAEAKKLRQKAMKAEVRKLNAALNKEAAHDPEFFQRPLNVVVSLLSESGATVATQTLRGYPQTNGDWLMLNGVQLFNKKTNKFNTSVISVEAQPTPRRTIGYSFLGR